MRSVEIKWLALDEAASTLVAKAPAKGDYFGIELRARYATTRPEDVVAQYHRTVQERAWAYSALLPKAQKERLVCGVCKRTGCKMWREYNTCDTDIFCGACALIDQGEEGPIDGDGYRKTDMGKCDQIGRLVPAVPDLEGLGFWGYTSVPSEAVKWWRSLPT